MIEGKSTSMPIRTAVALLTCCRFGHAEERFPGNQPGREKRASTARPDPEIDTADLRERIKHRDAPLPSCVRAGRMTCGEGVRKQRTRFRVKFEDVNRAEPFHKWSDCWQSGPQGLKPLSL